MHFRSQLGIGDLDIMSLSVSENDGDCRSVYFYIS
jgi:hypothetical protein